MYDVVVKRSRSLYHRLMSSCYNWIIFFLTGREQRCKVQDILSKAIGINLSMYRALGLDHPYIIMESDLYPKSSDNRLMKYADDTRLLDS